MKLIKEPVVNERVVRRRPRAMPQIQLDKPFTELTRPEQRVAIAHDVLLQLDAKRLEAKADQFLSLRYKGQSISWNTFPHSTLLAHEFSDETPERALENKCDVCAIGAVFVSLVRRRGKATFLDVGDTINDGIPEYATDVFHPDMLAGMEHYFEVHDVKRRMRHLGADGRLRAIMHNIIDNEGAFVPKELPCAPRG
jgi:hypothetical protein